MRACTIGHLNKTIAAIYICTSIYIYQSKRLRQGSARGLGKVELFRRWCLRLFCRCFTDPGAEMEDFDARKTRTAWKKYPKRPTWSQKGANMNQGIFKNTRAEQGRKNEEKGGGGSIYLWEHFWLKVDRNRIQKPFKHRSPQNMKCIPKGSPNGAEINARTGIEKDKDNYEKSCFFGMQNHAKPSYNRQKTSLRKLSARTRNSSTTRNVPRSIPQSIIHSDRYRSVVLERSVLEKALSWDQQQGARSRGL